LGKFLVKVGSIFSDQQTREIRASLHMHRRGTAPLSWEKTMLRKWLWGAAAVLGLAASLSTSAMAAPAVKPTATFGIYPGISTPIGVAPALIGGEMAFYQYAYEIVSGAGLSDTIPLQVCLDHSTLGSDSNGTVVIWSDQVTQNTVGALSGDVTILTSPWPFNSSDPTATIVSGQPQVNDPGCQSGTISISVPTSLVNNTNAPVGYETNILFSTQNGDPPTGDTKLNDGFDSPAKIHIFVQVDPPASTNRIACYMTDSNGDFLKLCDGTTLANQSGETDGPFAVVKNAKGTITATNPGQFYYNLLWNNTTGSDQIVNVNISRTGANPVGAQAVHWWIFPTSGFQGVTPTDFDVVNEGNPAGITGSISNITVPAGDTLYVTEHLEWSMLGTKASLAGCGADCGTATTQITVSGTVSSTDSAFADDKCTAGAVGYLKN
jgi:hypothetical protein